MSAPVTRSEVELALSSRDPRLLQRVLEAGEVRFPADATSAEMASKLTAALWRRTHTPLGQAIVPDALDDIIDTTAKRLDIDLRPGDAWQRLEELTGRLLPHDRVLSLEELDEPSRQKLEKALWLDLTGVSLSGTAAGARWLAKALLGWTKGPLWDLIRLIPRVGPILGAIRTGAGTVAAVSGPLGITIALLTLNHALGPRYDRALPLLLGVGLVLRNPVAVTPSGAYSS